MRGASPAREGGRKDRGGGGKGAKRKGMPASTVRAGGKERKSPRVRIEKKRSERSPRW